MVGFEYDLIMVQTIYIGSPKNYLHWLYWLNPGTIWQWFKLSTSDLWKTTYIDCIGRIRIWSDSGSNHPPVKEQSQVTRYMEQNHHHRLLVKCYIKDVNLWLVLPSEEYIDHHTVILAFIHQRISGVSYLLHSWVN